MDLMTAHLVTLQRHSARVSRNALPYAPVMVDDRRERRPAVAPAALKAVLLLASRALRRPAPPQERRPAPVP